MLTGGSNTMEGLFPLGTDVVQQWLPLMGDILEKKKTPEEPEALPCLGGDAARFV